MKKISELYAGYGDILINDIKINSKDVKKNDLFVCIKGVNTDRHDFVLEAIENGCSFIVASKKINVSVPVKYVSDTNKELIYLCRKFYDYDEDKLKLIGITGTNGKTTTALIIQDLLGNSVCGYIGTNGIISHSFNEKIRNTTPDADRLYKYFKMFRDDGNNYVSMEVSSEALYRERLRDINFNIGVVTNITEDHLNVHKTIENYVSCKKKILNHLTKDSFCILNVDDKYFDDFRNSCHSRILTYGMKESTLQIINIKEFINKTKVTIKYKNKKYSFSFPLLGKFNVYNLSSAMLSLIALGFDINYIIKRIPLIKTPHGRLEFLNYSKKHNIILDYAHTPDAFLNIYNYLDKVKKGKIITVTGSAGGREHEKRGVMGKLILDKSDYVIFTMDDPRWEDPNDIIKDLVSLSSKDNYEIIIDRKDAIYKALSILKHDDILLIAGKGDDNYMAIHDNYLPYSDREIVKEYFNKK